MGYFATNIAGRGVQRKWSGTYRPVCQAWASVENRGQGRTNYHACLELSLSLFLATIHSETPGTYAFFTQIVPQAERSTSPIALLSPNGISSEINNQNCEKHFQSNTFLALFQYNVKKFPPQMKIKQFFLFAFIFNNHLLKKLFYLTVLILI